MSTIMDPSKLKVVELRAELSARGLDTKGNKPVLVKRLREALEAETGEDVPDTSIVDTSTEDINSSITSQPSPPPERELTPEPVIIPPAESPPKSRSRSRRSDERKSRESDSSGHRKREPTPPSPEPSVKAQKKAVSVEEPEKKSTKSKLVEEEAMETDPEPELVVPDAPEEKVMDVDEAEQKQEEEQDEDMDENIADAADSNPEAADAEKDSSEPRNRKSRWGSAPADKTPDESTLPTPTTDDAAVVISDEPKDEQRGEKRRHASPSPERAVRKRSRSPIKEDEPEIDEKCTQLSWIDSDLNLQVDKENFTVAEPMHSEGFGYMWAGARATHGIKTGKVYFEVKLLENLEWDEAIRERKEREKREKREKQRERREQRDSEKKDQRESDRKEQRDSEKKDQKESDRKEQKDPDKKDQKESDKKDSVKKEETESDKEESVRKEETESDKKESIEKEETESDKKESITGEETESEIKDANIDSDMKNETESSEKEESKKEEQESEQEEKMEVKDEKQPDVKDETTEKEKEVAPVEPIHGFRVGWSLSTTDLQLGEQPHSYAYDSEGFSVTDSKFTEYGIKYKAGDVIGAFLDLGTSVVNISYTVNGELQPVAFSIENSELPEDYTFFPHVLTRNIKFEVNFGSKTPWFELPAELEEFKLVDNVDEKVEGRKRPVERKECEVIMMIGLPCSGKTHWVNNHVAENLEKKYNVIGLSSVLDKMKYRGQSRKEHFKGSTTVLMDKCTRCVTKLVDIACTRRRNFIIDQTNLFSSAQRRKMRPFDGFQRKAVVIVVADDEQSSREKSRQQADGKDVPDSAVLEMKANMSLPAACDWLDEVIYAELDETKAKEIVQKYNKQGREAGYGPNYTAKQHNNQKTKGMSDRRNQWGRNKRDSSREDRNNRWGGGGHNRPNNWGGNRGSSGWGRHDNRSHGGGRGGDYRSSSNNRMMSGGFNRQGGGGGYNRNRNPPPHRNQMPNKGGSWGGQGGNWNSQGSWGNQGGWGGHQSGGQGGGSGSGWNQGGWGQYGGNQGGQGGGGQQWKGGYNAQQYPQQGYAQGYAAGQYGQGQYANWNYYGQYAQGWNAQQGQSGGTSGNGTAQYNQYTQQQQAAWAQYAQGGYGGYGQAAAIGTGSGAGNSAVTGSTTKQQ